MNSIDAEGKMGRLAAGDPDPIHIPTYDLAGPQKQTLLATTSVAPEQNLAQSDLKSFQAAKHPAPCP